MAEIGHGYGSEFQLLRFLGHHRNEFEKIIRRNPHFEGEEKFEWLDFPYDSQRISLDGEYRGIYFLKKCIDNSLFSKLEEEWSKFWAKSGNQQNWDAVFLHENEFVLVEAKAHLGEIKKDSRAKSNDSIKLIRESLEATKKHFGIQNENDWTKKYYQAANRLAVIKFLTENNIKAHLLNVYFINGYTKRCPKSSKKVVVEDKSVHAEGDWRKEIKKQNDYLGINGSKAEEFVTSVFIDCKKEQN